MCYATPVQPKISTEKIIQRYIHSDWFFNALRKWFQRLTPAQLKSLLRYHCALHSHNLTFTTSVKFGFRILHFHKLKYNMVVHYICTTWFSRHLYNLISGFYTSTTWNLYLHGKATYFTLHSRTLIFITFAKYDFRCFFILVVCMFSYIYIFRSYIYDIYV